MDNSRARHPLDSDEKAIAGIMTLQPNAR